MSVLAAGAWVHSPAQAAGACTLAKLAEFPVTMHGLRPVISAKINGSAALFIVDSGAFYSTMSSSAALNFKLPLSPMPFRYQVIGVGGTFDVSLGMVKTLELADIPIRDIGFLVGGSEIGADGLLGQNVLGIGDIEYDLAHGTVRIIRPNDACAAATLAYWVPSGDSYSVMPISYPTQSDPHTTGVAFLNGVKIRVMFDSGASQSFLSIKTAERAGIKIDSPGVKAIGYAHGLGGKTSMSYLATFKSLKIGDEEVNNPHLRFGEIGADTDMLIGADFFLAHHIYVSNKQHRLYFTYNGGPVFDLREHAATESAAAPAQTEVAAAPPMPSKRADPTDADRAMASESSRRGMASLARRDYASALSDLNEACQMAPQPDYFLQRAAIYEAMNQFQAAMADYNQLLGAQPNYASGLVARASLEARMGKNTEAAADIDNLAKQVNATDNEQLYMAREYLLIGHWQQALDHYSLWISSHKNDGKRQEALAGRCAVRAYLHTELPGAVKDCTQALQLLAKSDVQKFAVYDHRALAYLQQSDYTHAIADYTSALGLKADDAEALFGRGAAHARLGPPDAGRVDIATAMTNDPGIQARFETYGVSTEKAPGP